MPAIDSIPGFKKQVQVLERDRDLREVFPPAHHPVLSAAEQAVVESDKARLLKLQQDHQKKIAKQKKKHKKQAAKQRKKGLKLAYPRSIDDYIIEGFLWLAGAFVIATIMFGGIFESSNDSRSWEQADCERENKIIAFHRESAKVRIENLEKFIKSSKSVKEAQAAYDALDDTYRDIRRQPQDCKNL